MTRSPARWTGMLAAFGLLLAPGCDPGDGLPREAVSGTVTLDGQPLASGSIAFMPSSPEVTVASGAPIVNGAYDVPAAQGPVPGSYRVEITSAPPEAKLDSAEGELPGMVPPQAADKIPEKYNAKSTLTAQIKAGESNVLNFDLTTKD